MKTQPIANSFGIMDAPLSEIPGICVAFIRRFDDYHQLAFEQGKHDFSNELEHSMNELYSFADKVNQGQPLSPSDRNDIRMTIKFTEKMAAGELIFTDND